MKNTQSRHVRNRTNGHDRPETRDRRVQRTKASLHDAVIGLARERPYPSIAVKDILDRANVGRSTFYTHFRDKDELLESGIHELLRSRRGRTGDPASADRVLAFSLPMLEYINGHRRANGAHMTRETRTVVHQHLREVLTNMIADDLASSTHRSQIGPRMPVELAARHIASTFVLVLDWWVEHEPALLPADVDARFRALVQPIFAM